MALVSPVQMLGLWMLGCRKAGLVVPRASDTETPQVLADAAVVVVFAFACTAPAWLLCCTSIDTCVVLIVMLPRMSSW